jgi:transposase
MMGERTVMQEALFYEFSLERHVPADHLLRSIDRFVDLSGIRAHLRPFYSEIGRPSIDPELMIRILSSAIASASVRNAGSARRCI